MTSYPIEVLSDDGEVTLLDVDEASDEAIRDSILSRNIGSPCSAPRSQGCRRCL
jgi:hypothetical protein